MISMDCPEFSYTVQVSYSTGEDKPSIDVEFPVSGEIFLLAVFLSVLQKHLDSEEKNSDDSKKDKG